jgi:hypothetical protein
VNGLWEICQWVTTPTPISKMLLLLTMLVVLLMLLLLLLLLMVWIMLMMGLGVDEVIPKSRSSRDYFIMYMEEFRKESFTNFKIWVVNKALEVEG